MHMKSGVALLLVLAMAMAGTALAQSSSVSNPYMPQRPNSVKPNSQNLLQGPSSWTRQQRNLNIPGAKSNPSLRQQAAPYQAQPPSTPQPLPRPPDAPVPAETPDKAPIL